jgi:hypothetical protein
VATVKGAVTLRVKAVVLVTPPPVAVTVTGKLPVGVALLVAIVKTEEHAGLQEAEEKDPAAPAGRPETLKETACVLPELSVVASVFKADEPATTDRSLEFDNVKLKLPVRESALVNQMLASALG